ncbi:MAG: class I SAM-dependent methyltransferase [Candidatus Rhabdochlamydia sp.]
MISTFFRCFQKILYFLQDALCIVYYHVKVPLFEWRESWWVKRHFYPHEQFRKIDRDLIKGMNPYHQSLAFPYGETPLRAFYLIGKKAKLNPSDLFLDLGCGRGRGVFFLSFFFNCRAKGVDLTAAFIQKATQVAHLYKKEKITFACEDFLTTDLREVTCVYFYGITHDEMVVKKVQENLTTLPLYGKVCMIDQPLSYNLTGQEGSSLPSFQVDFNWGTADVFLYEKTDVTFPMFTLYHDV